MFRPPFAARVMAGLAVTFVEETRRLPTTAATFPMTAVSQVLQTSMRVQQKMTELAIKGDEALAWLYPPEQQPEWVVFDDEPVETTGRSDERKAVTAGAGKSAVQGRFALYSAPVTSANSGAVNGAPDTAGNADTTLSAEPDGSDVPAVAQRIDYGTLTLAQLRARLRQLTVDDLTALLRYEESTFSRAPFLTMLSNRIATVSK
ncbi:lipid droplet-associated protein [Hoyosella sp. YIM 151337]|uniref:lipid droplet-associated protein n=1 Tax=Hoyosella sp. YIM 151337 TaxID=2992742 RepID=UPI00223591D7|nr:lipid droplet-associated protein [Hoyosella sp. YIM 151337]MCW4355068.1 lipid droplet-associated protein [Hoyosella sp. YIM 151337]